MYSIFTKFIIFSCRAHIMLVESIFEKNCLDTEAPAELSYLTASVSVMLIVTNIPGNILIVLAVVFDPNKNLRTPFNWLVVNLSAADLIVGFITQPISAHYHIKESLKMNKFPTELKILHMAYFISCTASIFSLTSLAVERYLAVRKPNTYRTKVTNKRIASTVAIIWFISLSLPQIYLHVGFTTYGFIFANTSIVVAVSIICITHALMRRKFGETRIKSAQKRNAHAQLWPTEAVVNKSAEEHCATVTSNTDSPSVIILNNELAKNNPQAVESTSAEANHIQIESRHQLHSANTNLSSPNAILTRRQLLEAKVTEMFLVVLIALLCCYGPSTIMIYFVNFCESCSCTTLHWFRDIHFMFTVTNSSINFFCYALRCTRFRKAFAKFLRIGRSRNFSRTNIRDQRG